MTQPLPLPSPNQGHLEEIRLDLIDQGDQLIRQEQNDDEIDALALSIVSNGLLQPIGVTPAADGRYQLLYGARRSLAFRRLNRATIPAMVIDKPSGTVRSTALLENAQRRPLTLREELDAVRQLHTADKLSPDSIAHLMGRTRSWVLRRLAVDSLPADLQTPLLDHTISLGVAESLSEISDDGLRAFGLQHAIASKLSIGAVQQMVEGFLSTPSIAEAVAAGTAAAQFPLNQPTLHYNCEGCGTSRPADQTRLVRVCAAGCPTGEEPAADGPDTPTPH